MMYFEMVAVFPQESLMDVQERERARIPRGFKPDLTSFPGGELHFQTTTSHKQMNLLPHVMRISAQ